MRAAVMDCGTNTFNLLIVDINGVQFNQVFSLKIPVKLGENGINSGIIAEKPFKRGIEAMKSFSEKLKDNQVQKVFAFATSAVRDAKNGKLFKEEIKKITGIDITIIDGNKEADLIFKGNKLAVPLKESPSLIMDIGGGSTEFIIGNKNGVLWKRSYRLGAARLLEKFNPSNPIKNSETEIINDYLTAELQDLIAAVKEYKPDELIGSSGAFDSVVEMIQVNIKNQPFLNNKTEFPVLLPDYLHISEIINKSTIEERRAMKGLVEMRVDMMVISCLLIDFIIKNFSLENFRVSTYSLKEGALFEIIHNNPIQ
jgi:exopolyphosphatase/guanosine-5'-triphosphate,3'-diphosphate pyrophosphatase